MDFARPLVSTPSVASQSKIRYMEEPVDATALGDAGGGENNDATTEEERVPNAALDRQVIAAANQAAKDMFIGSNDKDALTKEDAWLVDASRYTQRSTPIVNNGLIQAGDLVVIQESFDKLDFVYVKQGSIFQNRNGAFHHNDFINQPFGTKVRSRDLQGYGFLYLLKPTPELWTRSLNHRTQVVHELDQSQVVFQLYIRPNDVVVESGTGSGAMSHAILRTIAPSGHLHTYEFNQHRVEAARTEFAQHGLSHLVTVHHKDVCRGLVEAAFAAGNDADNDTGNGQQNVKKVQGQPPGFDLPGQSVNAVFLDLPEPWWAVPHAAFILLPNARLASYSPCVEQTQKTIAALEACGFHSITTMEYRLMEHYVDEVEYESPPSTKRPRVEPHNVAGYHEPASKPMVNGSGGTDDDDDENGGDETQDAETMDRQVDHSQMATDTKSSGMDPNSTSASISNPPGETNGNQQSNKMLVARPFVMMRGHSAFLTFATAGLQAQPDPNLAL